jgi:hypothetical protein
MKSLFLIVATQEVQSPSFSLPSFSPRLWVVTTLASFATTQPKRLYSELPAVKQPIAFVSAIPESAGLFEDCPTRGLL